MNKILDEGNLQFDFSGCPLVADPVKFDAKNPNGMMGVDFVAETEHHMYFIEVKDYQNPHPYAQEHQQKELEMLVATAKGKNEIGDDDPSAAKGSIFSLKISQKLKDSLLRKYASGEAITKKAVYLLLINLDKLGSHERALLKNKISGYIPTGLNGNQFTAFSSVTFDIVTAEQLKTYGITCTAKH